MKKATFFLSILFLSTSIMAQEKVKQKEIGITFNNLNNFGLAFKTGSNKSLWRFNTLFIIGRNQDEISDSLVKKNSNSGFGLQIGKEYRKDIVDNLELRLGFDLSFSYQNYKSIYNDKTVNNNDRSTEKITYEPGVNLVFGLNYVLNKQLVIGVELLPNLCYITGTSSEKYYYTNNGNVSKFDITGFRYGLSNSSALLSLSFRF